MKYKKALTWFAALGVFVVGFVAGALTYSIYVPKPFAPRPADFTALDYAKTGRWKCSFPGHFVIKDAGYWEKLWQRAHPTFAFPDMPAMPPPPPAPPPPVDFAKDMILAVFQGWRSSGGYSIRITEVSETDDQLIAVVAYREPRPSESTTAAETNPFCMVSVPRSDKRVVFRVVEVDHR